jgi:SAM-dependent methyltransferase
VEERVVRRDRSSGAAEMICEDRCLPSKHSHGSGEQFEGDWARVLLDQDSRWFVYPDPGRDDQVSLTEWVKAQEVLELLHARGVRNGRVLEYGCGAAGMSIFLKEHGFDVCAMDMSLSALKIARGNDERNRSVSRALPLAVADARSLPVADATFDIVMSYGLLEHFDEDALRTLLPEVIRTLKPGSVFVADICPGGLNMRLVGNVFSFVASSVSHLVRGESAALRKLSRRYFDHYYTSSFAPEVWESLLRRHGLQDVRIQVCRPFPMLAIWGKAEALYVRLLRLLLPLWLRFDRSRSPVKRRWGWMYLAIGTRRNAMLPPENSR